jgi:hypothetical protein
MQTKQEIVEAWIKWIEGLNLSPKQFEMMVEAVIKMKRGG